MPCHAMPCHAMPCHAMPCHAMPCHAMPECNNPNVVLLLGFVVKGSIYYAYHCVCLISCRDILVEDRQFHESVGTILFSSECNTTKCKETNMLQNMFAFCLDPWTCIVSCPCCSVTFTRAQGQGCGCPISSSH